ncbi:lipase member I-like isoform X1 [Leptidea sinapis]|uniref:lipase member I-like isoform X1 n=1 Tax=Leptidea sinapis TaxID=189913 RepID=UPI00212E82A9|nr:lipase member I-like isoform X1 [Leptidea sinapis]
MSRNGLYKIIYFFGIIQISELAWLRCYKGSIDNYVVAKLEEPIPLSNSSCFNRDLPTVVYTFGYRGRTDGPATTAVLNAYIATNKRNVLLLDWENEARSGVLGIPLGYVMYALPNSKRVGQQLGSALLNMHKAGFSLRQFHLIGHSLGAHLLGYTGRWIREHGQVIPRITGLDPARSMFEGFFAIQTGLDKTCAKFVDIIHSNPGNYGTTQSTGTVDIWPNYSPSDGMQPGCPGGKHEMFSMEDLCSHNRAWMLLVESLRNGTAFPTAAAESYEQWLAADHYTNVSTYLGDLVNTRAHGDFYLSTNAESPFSRGLEGLKPEYRTRVERQPATSDITQYLKLR